MQVPGNHAMIKDIYLVGSASGLAGVDERTAQGPVVVQASPYFAQLQSHFHWEAMISPQADTSASLYTRVHDVCEKLAKTITKLVKEDRFFVVVGGDHSCALGTWSGVYDAIHHEGELGLIWIDAHMDSHTPETSETGRIHGMPCASLLGYGPSELTNILHQHPKLKPENICSIGLRSYERGEAALLKKLNVRTYFIEEVKERGFAEVFREAVETVKRNTVAFGISLDLDAIDPPEVPGVDVPEPDGIAAKDIQAGLLAAAADPKLIGLEIVEFDPARDKDQITEKLVVNYLATISKGFNARANGR